MATKNSVHKPASVKKEYKKELAGKLEPALIDLKNKLGDKEFQHRLKKAIKLLTQGINHKKNIDNSSKNAKPATEQPAKKIKTVKKIKAKKQASVSPAN